MAHFDVTENIGLKINKSFICNLLSLTAELTMLTCGATTGAVASTTGLGGKIKESVVPAFGLVSNPFLFVNF